MILRWCEAAVCSGYLTWKNMKTTSRAMKNDVIACRWNYLGVFFTVWPVSCRWDQRALRALSPTWQSSFSAASPPPPPTSPPSSRRRRSPSWSALTWRTPCTPTTSQYQHEITCSQTFALKGHSRKRRRFRSLSSDKTCNRWSSFVF